MLQSRQKDEEEEEVREQHIGTLWSSANDQARSQEQELIDICHEAPSGVWNLD
ncbi:hypothetical protein FE257_009028 [Aspergillus nanangensis]|uniref:Uncharacterized protein n=1 Tax=Aspergillus nanangensis TaxID=2582783 RepID=A0AAD4GYS8_ASPNN|nr:hypothetical protein FE257_009028 [Aspergillus nanangensis]